MENAPSCPPCPKCGKTYTRYTVQALHGTYCYCDSCEHAWYHETCAPPPPQHPTPAKDTNA